MVFRMIREMLVARRMNRAAGEASTGSVCVACDSKDVTELASEAYRCNMCGHEGGDGYAAYQRGLRNASFERLTPEEREEGARKDLLEARRLLISAAGDLHRASIASGIDMVGFGGGMSTGEGNEKQSAMTSALGFMHEAKNRVDDAKVKLVLNLNTDMESTDGQDSYLSWSADLYFDNIFTDMKFHGKIVKAQQEANRMVSVVERILVDELGVSLEGR